MSKQHREPLYDLPFIVHTHVESLRPLVERLYADSPGFVETVDGRDHLTERGRASIPAAHRIALEAYEHFDTIWAHHRTPTPHHYLLQRLACDAAQLFSVLSAALAGLEEHPNPCNATWGMRALLDDLEKRSEGDEVDRAVDFVFDHPADTLAQAAALMEQYGGREGPAEAEEVAHV